MINEKEVLLLQQGQNKLFMLLRSGSVFHLVSVDKRLMEETEEKLMQLYPCSDQTLREMKLNFQALTLRGVAISGPEAGDAVTLYTGKEKRKFVFSDDYDPEVLDAFFAGMERFQPPKKKRSKNPDAWRLAQQDEKLVPVMRTVKRVLLALSIVSSVLLVFHHPLWSALGILCSVTCGVLDLVYPAYFTLLEMSNGKKQKHAIGLGLSAALPLMVQTLYVFYRFNFLNFEIFLWAVAVALLAWVVFGFFGREFSERTGDLLAMVLLLALFGSGPIGMMNYLTDRSEPRQYVTCVDDMYVSSSSKGGDNYFCTILLEDGSEFDLQVQRGQYEQFSVGDTIEIATRAGGLGIEYIFLTED